MAVPVAVALAVARRHACVCSCGAGVCSCHVVSCGIVLGAPCGLCVACGVWGVVCVWLVPCWCATPVPGAHMPCNLPPAVPACALAVCAVWACV